MFSENPQVESRSCTPWTKYHYALLTCKGVSFLFDTLRYEDAFPCRKADVEALKRSMKGLEAVLDDFTLLICKYGEGRPNWTLPRLMSTQRLEVLPYATVVVMDPDFSAPKPGSRLKYSNEVTVTGTLDTILDTLYLNHAMPASEADAHIIEQAPYSPDETLTVRLRNFGCTPGWDFHRAGGQS